MIIIYFFLKIFLSFMEEKNRKKELSDRITFECLKLKIKDFNRKTISLICPENTEIMKTVSECLDICNFILIGEEAKIISLSKEISLSLLDESIKIINSDEPAKSLELGLNLINTKQADMLMKGNIPTKDILHACFRKDTGLRIGKLVTSVSLFDIQKLNRMIFLSDPAVILRPTVEQKIEQINYIVDVAKSIGIFNPKIAPLTAIETVNDKMIETIEAEKLMKMNEEGKIKDCIIDGPISFDLAIDPKASTLKNAEKRRIVGDADALLTPDIHSANFIYKIFTHIINAECANIIVGTKVPILITSRSDTSKNKKSF